MEEGDHGFSRGSSDPLSRAFQTARPPSCHTLSLAPAPLPYAINQFEPSNRLFCSFDGIDDRDPLFLRLSLPFDFYLLSNVTATAPLVPRVSASSVVSYMPQLGIPGYSNLP
jgi:hypothetical protein